MIRMFLCRTYVYATASALPSGWSRPQCRKHLVMVPQTTPAAGSGRPHDVRKGIIRRQGGRLPRCSIQRVRMGLRATGSPCLSLSCDLAPLATSCRICRARSGSVAVRGHLLRGKRRGPDSAGNTQSAPSTPRLPGLRRGSHNAPHSTAAGCWQPRNWHRTGCACATETPLSG